MAVFTVLAWLDARHRLSGERRERVEEIQQEHRSREEELRLLRDQLDLYRSDLEAREQDRVASRVARLAAHKPRRFGGERFDKYVWQVENMGPGVAFDLVAHAVAPSGYRVASSEPWPSLRVGAQWPVELEILRAAATEEALRLVITWGDDGGEQEADLTAIAPLR